MKVKIGLDRITLYSESQIDMDILQKLNDNPLTAMGGSSARGSSGDWDSTVIRWDDGLQNSGGHEGTEAPVEKRHNKKET